MVISFYYSLAGQHKKDKLVAVSMQSMLGWSIFHIMVWISSYSGHDGIVGAFFKKKSYSCGYTWLQRKIEGIIKTSESTKRSNYFVSPTETRKREENVEQTKRWSNRNQMNQQKPELKCNSTSEGAGITKPSGCNHLLAFGPFLQCYCCFIWQCFCHLGCNH